MDPSGAVAGAEGVGVGIGAGDARLMPIATAAVPAGRAGLAIGIGSPPPHAARCHASGSRGAARGAVARRGASSEATALVRAGRAAAVAAVLPVLLAGCGADGAPVPPGPPPPEAGTGATITGQASLGVAGRL